MNDTPSTPNNQTNKSSFETPRKTESKKRELSSPEDEQELKKQLVSTPEKQDSLPIAMSTPASPVSLTPPKIGSLSTEELKAVAEFLKASFKPDLESMATGIVTAVMTGIIKRVDDLEKSNSVLVSENIDLKRKIDILEKKHDDLEQYGRRNSLRISGIQENGENENTDKIIVDICSALDIPVGQADICRSHRVGKKHDTVPPSKKPGDPQGGAVSKPKPRAIIVKFSTYRARRSFYMAKSNLSLCGYRDVFINEDLTKERNSLLYHARMKVKSKSLQGAWSSDGNILVKDKNGKVSRIQHIDDLDTLNY